MKTWNLIKALECWVQALQLFRYLPRRIRGFFIWGHLVPNRSSSPYRVGNEREQVPLPIRKLGTFCHWYPLADINGSFAFAAFVRGARFRIGLLPLAEFLKRSHQIFEYNRFVRVQSKCFHVSELQTIWKVQEIDNVWEKNNLPEGREENFPGRLKL